MTGNPTTRGIAMMIATTAMLAVQDGISRHLAGSYGTLMIVTLRYWFLAAFVVVLALRRMGGLHAVATRQFRLHFLRAGLLVTEVCVTIKAFTLIGLVESHALFAVSPVMVSALAGPMLGERLDLGRWLAIGAALLGVLVILNPGSGVFSPHAALPIGAALLWALYSILTRKASAQDGSLVSLFWSGVLGAAMLTPFGLAGLVPMRGADWGWMAAYGAVATLASWLFIRSYELAEASVLQPFAYLQLVFVTLIGIGIFGETLRPNAVIGALVVVVAGVATILRTRAADRQPDNRA